MVIIGGYLEQVFRNSHLLPVLTNDYYSNDDNLSQLNLRNGRNRGLFHYN